MIRDEILLAPVVDRLCESPAIRTLAETSSDFYSDLESPQYRELVREVILEIASNVNDAFQQIARAANSVDDDRHQALMDVLDKAHLQARARGTTYTCIYGRCGGASITTTEHVIGERWMDAHVEEHPHSGDYPVAFRVDFPGRTVPSVDYRDAVLIDDANTFTPTGPLVQDARVTS